MTTARRGEEKEHEEQPVVKRSRSIGRVTENNEVVRRLRSAKGGNEKHFMSGETGEWTK